MADLTSADKHIIAEQLIQIIKQNGEYVSEGYRIRFPEIPEGLVQSNLPSDLKYATITESNIFGFFREIGNIKVELKADGSTHWLYLKPSKAISIDDLKTEAKLVVDSMKSSKGVDASGQCRISVKELGAELSSKIVFFEYLLRKNNLTAKEFIQQLSKELISRQEKISITQATKAVGSNLQASSDNTLTYESEDDINAYTDEDVWNDIVRIVQRHNDNGQIVLGTLSTALAAESKAYAWAKGRYKGYVRSFLTDKFGHLLTIDYVDGRDVVILTGAEYQEKTAKKKGASKAKEANKAPGTSVEANQTSDKLSRLEDDFRSLSVDELSALKLIMQLVFNYCGSTISGSITRLTKKTKEEDNNDLTSAVDHVQLNILATLIRNKKMKAVIDAYDIDVIIDALTTELTSRGIVSENGKGTIPGGSFTTQSVEVIANAEFDGLDDWLPF